MNKLEWMMKRRKDRRLMSSSKSLRADGIWSKSGIFMVFGLRPALVIAGCGGLLGFGLARLIVPGMLGVPHPGWVAAIFTVVGAFSFVFVANLLRVGTKSP